MRLLLEDGVDEGRERGGLREDEERAEQQQDEDHRQQPQLLVLAQEHPDLTRQRELAHKKLSLLRCSKIFGTRAPVFSEQPLEPLARLPRPLALDPVALRAAAAPPQRVAPREP